jgi:nucleoid-associated protein YgaU
MAFTEKTRYKEFGLVSHYEYSSEDRIIDSDFEKESLVCLRRSTNYFSILETLVHCIKPGENYHNLAMHYYGDSRLWWFIADYNTKTSLELKQDDKIIIPPTTEVRSY